jgi:hypothetical protein
MSVNSSNDSLPQNVNIKPKTNKHFKTEQETYELRLHEKVLERTGQEMQSVVFSRHSRNFQPFSHSEVSPRTGDVFFRENQNRMEEVMESKQIHCLEEQKQILDVVTLLQGRAAKRKLMSDEEKVTNPPLADNVYWFIATLLRLILAEVTIDQECFYLVVLKVFSKADHHNPLTLQVVSYVRNALKISPKSHLKFLIENDITVRPYTAS